MAAITDLSDAINLATGGGTYQPQKPFVLKTNRVGSAAASAPVVGQWTSFWEYEGAPSGGAAPGAAAVPTSSTTGAIPLTTPTGELWLAGLEVALNYPGTLLLYDRLLHCSGLSGTSTSAQTVGGTLTRNTGGVGNIICAEVYTIIGTTGTTITCSYTDTSDNSATSTATVIGGTGYREAQRLLFLPLADGDNGVKAVASATLAGTTGTAGDFGINIIKPIATVGINSGGGGIADFISGIPKLPEIDSGACLALAFMPATTNALVGFCSLTILEK
jgi:hypothetical protein